VPRSVRPDRLTLLLLALGAVGLAAFLALYPRAHPDAAASFALGPAGAVERAEAFLVGYGYDTAGLIPHARLARDRALLDSLQAAVGRPTAVRALRDGARERLPAHYWRVTWTPPEGEDRLIVRLTLSGAVWSLANPETREPERRGDPGTAPRMFSLDGPVEAADLPPESDALDARAAVRLAQAHLDATALAALPLAVARVEPQRGRSAARVTFETTEPVLGQRVDADVDVAADGALLALAARFNGAPPSPVMLGMQVGAGGGGPFETAKWVGFVLLGVILLWVVLRRLSARAVDVSAALKDTALAAGLGAASVALGLPMFGPETGVGERLLFVGIGGLFSGLGIGLTVFMASAAADTLARERTPRAIHTLGLARQGAWVNVPVGRSLLRGVGLGGAVLGVAASGWALIPGAVLSPPGSFVESQLTFSLVASAVVGSVWLALLAVQGVLVAVGALVGRWRPGLVAAVLTLVVAALYIEFVAVPSGPAAERVAVVLAVGAVLAVGYLRTDALTALAALFVVGVLASTAEGVIVPASPARLDFALALGVVAAVGGVGVAGLRSGRTGDTLPTYEPVFITEQRERARMQRDLEIAREVQRSFLPQRVPEVAGVDLAARCLPAEAVGGDYYDLVRLGPERLGVVVGDVSGKGIQAAFFMTLVKGFLLSLAGQDAPPAEVLRRLNRLFAASAPRGVFTSMLYGVLDLSACTFTFARAGHTPLLVRRASGAVEVVRPPGLAIGMTAGAAFDRTLEEATVELCPGDSLVLYTDGVSEAMDARRQLYTDARLAEAVAAAPAAAPALLDAVVADVHAHTGATGLDDDLTLVVLHVPVPVAPSPRPSLAADAV